RSLGPDGVGGDAGFQLLDPQRLRPGLDLRLDLRLALAAPLHQLLQPLHLVARFPFCLGRGGGSAGAPAAPSGLSRWRSLKKGGRSRSVRAVDHGCRDSRRGSGGGLGEWGFPHASCRASLPSSASIVLLYAGGANQTWTKRRQKRER